MDKKICPMYPCSKCQELAQLTGTVMKCPFKAKIERQGNKQEAKNG